MKNKARPLSVDRFEYKPTSKAHYLTGLRGWLKYWTKYSYYNDYNLAIRKRNQLNNDCN